MCFFGLSVSVINAFIKFYKASVKLFQLSSTLNYVILNFVVFFEDICLRNIQFLVFFPICF